MGVQAGLAADLDDLDDLAGEALFHLLVHLLPGFDQVTILHKLHCQLCRFLMPGMDAAARKETRRACSFR